MGQTSGQRDEKFEAILKAFLEPLQKVMRVFTPVTKVDYDSTYEETQVYSANALNPELKKISECLPISNIITEFDESNVARDQYEEKQLYNANAVNAGLLYIAERVVKLEQQAEVINEVSVIVGGP